MMTKRKSAVVLGVGPENGLGAALCRRFSAERYHVYVAGRTVGKIEQVAATINAGGGSAEPVVMDATCEADVIRLFNHAFRSDADAEVPDLLVFNAGNNQRIDFRETSVEDFEAFWRVGCLAGFIFGREAARWLVPLGRGTVLFTGASASLRGKPGFAHFAAAKSGLRAVSQSMAREFGPAGLHVAHVVLDGGINGERMHTRFPAFLAQRGESGLLSIDGIADAYWFLHRQPPTVWSQEIDLRPSKEPF